MSGEWMRVMMADKTYIIRFKFPELDTKLVIAATYEMEDDYLGFLNSKGELTAMFWCEFVESWTELPAANAVIGLAAS